MVRPSSSVDIWIWNSAHNNNSRSQIQEIREPDNRSPKVSQCASQFWMLQRAADIGTVQWFHIISLQSLVSDTWCTEEKSTRKDGKMRHEFLFLLLAKLASHCFRHEWIHHSSARNAHRHYWYFCFGSSLPWRVIVTTTNVSGSIGTSRLIWVCEGDCYRILDECFLSNFDTNDYCPNLMCPAGRGRMHPCLRQRAAVQFLGRYGIGGILSHGLLCRSERWY